MLRASTLQRRHFGCTGENPSVDAFRPAESAGTAPGRTGLGVYTSIIPYTPEVSTLKCRRLGETVGALLKRPGLSTAGCRTDYDRNGSRKKKQMDLCGIDSISNPDSSISRLRRAGRYACCAIRTKCMRRSEIIRRDPGRQVTKLDLLTHREPEVGAARTRGVRGPVRSSPHLSHPPEALPQA